MPCTSTCVNLLKSGHYLYYSSCNQSHSLIEFLIVNCYIPLSICTEQIEKLKTDVLKPIPSVLFKSLIVALFSVIPPRMWYCVSVTIFLGRSNSKGFHLDWTTIMAIIPRVRETIWKFCQLLSIYISSIYFWIRNIIQDEFRDPLYQLCTMLHPSLLVFLGISWNQNLLVFLGTSWNQS